MKLNDIAAMAAHNLWQRKLRTALNLMGVVIGCIILLMTAAGAGGVSNAVHALFDTSEFARQIGVFRGGLTSADPPPEAIKVVGQMSDDRRERIREAMTMEWKRAQPRSQWIMTQAALDEIEKIPHVELVVPEVFLKGSLRLDGAELVASIVSSVPDSASMRSRVIAGRTLGDADRTGALLDEFLAYRLGFQSDPQLNDLIGRKIAFTYRIRGGRISTIYNLLTQNWDQLSQQEFGEQAQFMQAFLQLIEDLDATTLSTQQKELVRKVMKQASGLQINPEAIEMTMSFQIRGIVRKGLGENISSLFRQYFHDVSSGEIYVHHEVASSMYLADPQQESFYQALVSVDSTRNLELVTAELEKRGARAESSVWVLKNIDDQIARNAWIVYAIAAAVLLTSAIGISNTLIISVLERTPEFGIMKSVGAKDSDLVLLMIVEGGILGASGAVIAIASSWLIALLGHRILEWYVESRLGTEVTTSLFQFSLAPALIVLAVAIAVCAAASILPAWRAARLDPITAMRRT